MPTPLRKGAIVHASILLGYKRVAILTRAFKARSRPKLYVRSKQLIDDRALCCYAPGSLCPSLRSCVVFPFCWIFATALALHCLAPVSAASDWSGKTVILKKPGIKIGCVAIGGEQIYLAELTGL